jgi:4-azaleucine resistance transporter AzlC
MKQDKVKKAFYRDIKNKVKKYRVKSSTDKRDIDIKDGLKAGLSVCIGYFPIGMAFGMLSKGADLSFLEALSFSFIVFAGASQFIAVSMIAIGASAWEIIATTLFLNFRHFLMSASLAPRISFNHKKLKPIIGFFVTDETFSVASFREGTLSESFILSLEIISYLGWCIGSGVGYLLGSVLPPLMQESMGIGLYAMFIALLAPELKKTSKALVLALLSGILNTFLRYQLRLAEGWSIVIAIILVSSLGVILYQGEYALSMNEVEGGLDRE